MNRYTDERGYIQEVSEGDYKAIQMIWSRKGAVRSNHYHKTGGHLLYVVSGSMRYLERRVGDTATAERTVSAGESVFTGPMIEHATEFLEDTLLVCAATVNRADGAYADDLVKVKLL
mgnify:FL=1